MSYFPYAFAVSTVQNNDNWSTFGRVTVKHILSAYIDHRQSVVLLESVFLQTGVDTFNVMWEVLRCVDIHSNCETIYTEITKVDEDWPDLQSLYLATFYGL